MIATTIETFNPADFLKWGQMGLALFMALLGWKLFKGAAESKGDITAKSRNALMFMISGVVLFIFSLIGEIILKLNPPAAESFHALITVPPLDESNVETYGKNMVHGGEVPVLAGITPQKILVKEGATLIVNLTPFESAFRKLQAQTQGLANQLNKTTPDFGASTAE